MSGTARIAPHHRFRPATDDVLSGQDWLANLDPDKFRYGPTRAINHTAIAEAAGLPLPTLHRAMRETNPLTEHVLSALKALAMKYDLDETSAQQGMFEFVRPHAAENKRTATPGWAAPSGRQAVAA